MRIIEPKKAPKTTLQELCQEKKYAQIQAKKAPTTTLKTPS